MAEDGKTKDLLIKLQILTNGLIEERKKSQHYLDKIKELEKILETKDNEIILLSKAKFDLQADLTFERSKRDTKQGGKKFSKEMQIEQYEEIINEQGVSGDVEDIAGVVSFLASKDAGYVTGQVIEISGGIMM